MLVSELTTSMLREWSETSDDDEKVSLMEEYIKNALDDFSLTTNFREVRNYTNLLTVASVDNYELPADVRDITDMRIESLQSPIEQRSFLELRMTGISLAQAGVPRYWDYYSSADDGDSNRIRRIVLWPVPDANYTISYGHYKNIRSLSATDVIPIANEYITIIKDRIRWQMSMEDKDFDAADRFDQKYVEKVRLVLQRSSKAPANRMQLQITDVSSSNNNLARLDPSHFSLYSI